MFIFVPIRVHIVVEPKGVDLGGPPLLVTRPSEFTSILSSSFVFFDFLALFAPLSLVGTPMVVWVFVRSFVVGRFVERFVSLFFFFSKAGFRRDMKMHEDQCGFFCQQCGWRRCNEPLSHEMNAGTPCLCHVGQVRNCSQDPRPYPAPPPGPPPVRPEPEPADGADTDSHGTSQGP